MAGALVYIHSSRPANPPRMDWPGADSGLRRAVPDRLRLLPRRDGRLDRHADHRHPGRSGWSLLAGFVLAERRVSHPLLPLRVVLDRTRGGAYMAVGLAGIAIFGVFLFLTYYLQQIKGYSPVTTGLLFLPMIGVHPGQLQRSPASCCCPGSGRAS